MNRRASDPPASVATLDSPGAKMGAREDLHLSLQRESRIDGQPLTGREGMWAGTVRRTAVAKLHYWRLGDLAEDAGLLISELITNALRYGTGETIEFHFELNSDTVLIEVDDGSPSRPYVRETGPEEESGRGMLLVSALATDWGVSPDGTRTWCTLVHARPEPGRPMSSESGPTVPSPLPLRRKHTPHMSEPASIERACINRICGEPATLPTDVVLKALRYAHRSVIGTDDIGDVRCTLQVHSVAEPHYGFIVDTDPTTGAWTRWANDTVPQVVLVLPDCPATDPGQDRVCSEYEGHRGGHTWQVEDPWNPSEPAQ